MTNPADAQLMRNLLVLLRKAEINCNESIPSRSAAYPAEFLAAVPVRTKMPAPMICLQDERDASV
jgi:hypothetical protein